MPGGFAAPGFVGPLLLGCNRDIRFSITVDVQLQRHVRCFTIIHELHNINLSTEKVVSPALSRLLDR
jgi:hypothetical protein